MQTIIHTYFFRTDAPAEGEAHKALQAKLTAMGLKCFNVIAAARDDLPFEDGQVIELETKHLFSNQWNASNHRVFDWYEAIVPNPRVKRGHWLEQTPKMTAIRLHTLECGYCGHQRPDTSPYKFCPDCLDSEYLKSTDLHLTRLRPISTTGSFLSITESELAELLPRYKEAQIHGGAKRTATRIATQRTRIDRDYTDRMRNATTERDGFLWCLDRGLNIDNVLYYNHTQVFCFGWRSPIDSAIRDDLVKSLEGFPFAYEIK